MEELRQTDTDRQTDAINSRLIKFLRVLEECARAHVLPPRWLPLHKCYPRVYHQVEAEAGMSMDDSMTD